MVRIIHLRHMDPSTGEVFGERIAITDDQKTPAKDFCPVGFDMVTDMEYDIDMPSSFPLNSEFRKD